jgi:hypothetical protein
MKSVSILLPWGLLAAATAFFAGYTVPVSAHHSAAMFDVSKTVEHKGTVKSFLWNNPHCLLVLSVREQNGEPQDYSYEFDGPGYLVRNGWTRTTLKPGDEITVTSNPLIEGGRGGKLVDVTLADGRRLSAAPKLFTPSEKDKAQ